MQSFVYHRAVKANIMRYLVILVLALLAASCLNASPVRESWEVQRPPRTPQFVKGQKGSTVPNPLNLRKGEYICGNKICKLKPGQIPPNCEGVCQYRV